MVTKLLLVRHGETIWNQEQRYQGFMDIPLSEKGRAQAQKLSKRLACEKIDAFYASDLSRAFETAEIIAAPHQKEVTPIPGLRETNFGIWEGLKFKDIREQYGEIMTKWLEDPLGIRLPNGESLGDVRDRSQKALQEIVERHPDQTVLVAAHGGTIKVTLAEVIGFDIKGYWRIKQDNLALNIIEYYGDKAIVCLVNDIYHLNELCQDA